jgi:hypothetical protein
LAHVPRRKQKVEEVGADSTLATFARSADMLELAMWEVPHRLARDGATDAGWRCPVSFYAGRALVVGPAR